MRRGKDIKQTPEPLDLQNYPEAVKAIFSEAKRLGDAKEVEKVPTW